MLVRVQPFYGMLLNMSVQTSSTRIESEYRDECRWNYMSRVRLPPAPFVKSYGAVAQLVRAVFHQYCHRGKVVFFGKVTANAGVTTWYSWFKPTLCESGGHTEIVAVTRTSEDF